MELACTQHDCQLLAPHGEQLNLSKWELCLQSRLEDEMLCLCSRRTHACRKDIKLLKCLKWRCGSQPCLSQSPRAMQLHASWDESKTPSSCPQPWV